MCRNIEDHSATVVLILALRRCLRVLSICRFSQPFGFSARTAAGLCRASREHAADAVVAKVVLKATSVTGSIRVHVSGWPEASRSLRAFVRIVPRQALGRLVLAAPVVL